MRLPIFGFEVDIKDEHCHFNENPGRKVEKPYVNVYVRLTDVCNATCGFCEFHGEDTVKFDEYKFYYMLMRLNQQVTINKLSFTGGEPTVQIDLLNRALKTVKEINPNIFTIVNTNGFKWTEIDVQYVDSIALSVHHYDQNKCRLILGVNYDVFDYICNFEPKEKLHLSCNLIRGQVDSTEKAYNYINFWGMCGVIDIGFVSLMKRNQYCKDFFIDFDDVKLGEMSNTLVQANWKQEVKGKTSCKCANFLTYTDNGSIVKSYARYYMDTTECKSMLVYDVDRLKVGFNGITIFE